ncbi:hypothetical protein NPIL_527691 [Nephila pilipes]|uniref:Uncharacterized protein n=1 Tax=Nephila pilipes TaxID=299642 RepID=A0A8X6P802_NEPPI|nr:hypothetical protein NPIL_527691 [Nephila pilipes]
MDLMFVLFPDSMYVLHIKKHLLEQCFLIEPILPALKRRMETVPVQEELVGTESKELVETESEELEEIGLEELKEIGLEELEEIGLEELEEIGLDELVEAC